MLSKFEIQYIVDWAESGNEPRESVPPGLHIFCDWHPYEASSEFTLSKAGLAVAAQAKENEKLREAFEHACRLVEVACEWGALELSESELRTMRANFRELCDE